MPAPDKIRSWRLETCRFPDCEFASKAEFEWLRHMDENPGHEVGASEKPTAIASVPADAFPFQETEKTDGR